MPKVFGIGLPKTGTKSLAAALQLLGYMSLYNSRPWRERIRSKGCYECPDPAWVAADKAAITNFGEWHFQQLADTYPDSKFILTLRPLDEWLDSCQRWFAKPGDSLVRIDIFGMTCFNAKRYEFLYWKHLEAVHSFADSHPVLRFWSPFRWEELCSFLEVPVPDAPYPYENKNPVTS